jgi:hypothetical protein
VTAREADRTFHDIPGLNIGGRGCETDYMIGLIQKVARIVAPDINDIVDGNRRRQDGGGQPDAGACQQSANDLLHRQFLMDVKNRKDTP